MTQWVPSSVNGTDCKGLFNWGWILAPTPSLVVFAIPDELTTQQAFVNGVETVLSAVTVQNSTDATVTTDSTLTWTETATSTLSMTNSSQTSQKTSLKYSVNASTTVLSITPKVDVSLTDDVTITTESSLTNGTTSTATTTCSITYKASVPPQSAVNVTLAANSVYNISAYGLGSAAATIIQPGGNGYITYGYTNARLQLTDASAMTHHHIVSKNVTAEGDPVVTRTALSSNEIVRQLVESAQVSGEQAKCSCSC